MSVHHTPVDPFAGDPPTFDYLEDSVPVIRVDALAHEPFRMKVARGLFILSLLGAPVLYAVLRDEHGLPAPYRLLFWCGVTAAAIVILALPMTRLTVKFTPAQILVRRGWFGEPWQAFDVVHEPAFVITDHRKAQAEARNHQRTTRLKPSADPEVIYGNAFHLFLDYRKQRYTLMTVLGDQDAQRIFMRLRACADIAKARAGKGGAPVEPRHDWPDRPGRIPGARRNS